MSRFRFFISSIIDLSGAAPLGGTRLCGLVNVARRKPLIDVEQFDTQQLIAFMFGTAAGVLFGKLMCVMSGGKINPLIGSAGVSAVPMAARVSQKVGAESDPTNFLLMHAMGPNVAGVIGTAVAAGTFMAIFGVF